MNKIFLSYRESDRQYVDGFRGMLTNRNNILDYFSYYSKQNLLPKGKEAVRQDILYKMKNSSVFICLVGENTHNSDWINWEAQVALSQRKKIILVRIPNTKGSPPQDLKKFRIIPWDKDSIGNALR